MSESNKKLLMYALTAISMIVALIGAYFGIKLPMPPLPDNAVVAERGLQATDLSSLNVDHNLTVGGSITANAATYLNSNVVMEGATADGYETTLTTTDPTADRTVTLPNMSGTVLVTNTPKILAFGTNTVTNTLTLSHGIVGPTQVFCTLTQDSAANAATCSATISSDTIVLKLWQADGTTAGATGKQIAWMVVGPGQ